MKAILEYKEMEAYNNYGEVWNHIRSVCLMGSDIKHACVVSPRSCQFGRVLWCMCTMLDTKYSFNLYPSTVEVR